MVGAEKVLVCVNFDGSYDALCKEIGKWNRVEED